MTSDECLQAISKAFGDAETWAPTGTWQFYVESTPKREIVLMPRFVAANISGPGMTPDDLTTHLEAIGPKSWAVRADGAHTIVLS